MPCFKCGGKTLEWVMFQGNGLKNFYNRTITYPACTVKVEKLQLKCTQGIKIQRSWNVP